MFDSLQDEIARNEGAPEPTSRRLLRYAGIALAAMAAVWALCAGILALE